MAPCLAWSGRGASISRKVTDNRGRPVAGICVFTVNARDGSLVKAGVSRADGGYTVNALLAGTYAVLYYGGQCGNAGSYAPAYYNGEANEGAATALKVTAGHAMTGIDEVMQPGATIIGTLTGPSGHNEDSVCVNIYPVADTQTIPNIFQGYQAFPINGKYTFTNIPPGLYLTEFGCFEGVPPPGLAGQWGVGRPVSTVADYISAAGGAVTTVTSVLRRAGSITGQVTSPAGHPIVGACVLAIPLRSPYPLLVGPYPTLHPDPNDTNANLPPSVKRPQWWRNTCG